MLDWYLLSGVKRVMVDLEGEMDRSRTSAQRLTREAWVVRALEAVEMSVLEKESVKSSAYDDVSCGDWG